MTRTQAVTLPTMPPEIVQQLEQAHQLIDQASSPDEAAELGNQARLIAAAIRAADVSKEAQNRAALLHLTAERKLGALLSQTIVPRSRVPEHRLPEGVDKNRSRRAQKLARIADADWDSWIANTISAGKEITQAAALRIAPVEPREERKSLADTYAAPAIDTSIARAFGIDAADERADLIVTAIRTALDELENPRQAYVWARYHGINDDGTEGEQWTFDGIARMNGWSRPYVESQYYRASHHVRGRIAVAALNQLAQVMAAA